MRVILSPRAEKQLKKLSKVDQIILAKKIREIRDKPAISKEEKLKGLKNIFRVRVGDYRIVYKKTKQQIYIILIGHRKDIYRFLKQLFR
ncbi:type II toxin-antitoxin system RelE/ParE family toxin [Candidatus Microgenomates bacterium]|nr:type II toxin-antitoxin system RelE/ParE family toxin [Candidatus Microgenomates bacterium]